MEKDSVKSVSSILRVLFRVIQGAVIGLGAVLPGISGGVLCVVFGIYKPIMELLSHPLKNFKTHVPKLLPVIVGLGVGFMGIANLLSFFLEKYPAPSVCLFVGLIVGHGCCVRPTAWPAVFFCANYPQLRLVSFLWFLPGFERHCSGYELFHPVDAAGTLYALCGWYRPFKHGGFAPRRLRGTDYSHSFGESRQRSV